MVYGYKLSFVCFHDPDSVFTYDAHYIGSTSTAILGALEPVTALFFGVLLFHEKLTPRLMVGILMIITAVTLIIIGKSLIKKMGMLLQMNKK